MKSWYKKLLIVALFIVANIFLWRVLRIGDWCTLTEIQQKRELLEQFVVTHYWSSIALFIGVYILDGICALPATSLLIITGGFLFGTVPAAICTVIGATIGGTGLFLMTRYLFGKSLQKKYQHRLVNFNNQIHHHGAWYLLGVRIIPIIPFFLVNILSGLTLVPVRTFVWTTAVGVIPSGIIYAYLGQRLMTVNSMRDFFSPGMIIIFCVLILMAVIPAVWYTVRARAAK